MSLFPSRRSPETEARSISRPLSRVMLGAACFLALGMTVGMVSLRPLLRHAILKNAADNYARFVAYQVAGLIGSLENAEYWQFDSSGLSAVLTRASRLKGISEIRILGPDGQTVEQKVVLNTAGRTVQGKSAIIFNNRPMGRVLVSAVVPDIKEPLGSFGFLTAAHLATLTAHNYGILISNQIAVLIGALEDPSLWEYDADKISRILINASTLEGIVRMSILDSRGAVIAESGKERNGKAEGYMSVVQSDIVFNNNVVGEVQVYFDFPGIRTITLEFQLALLALLLLTGSTIYFLPTRTVESLERSLLELNSELEMKVEQRTGQLEKTAAQLSRELAERKRLEASIVQREKLAAVGQLAAGVAHEINNPVGIILGFAQSVAREVKEDDPLALPLKSIEREAVRCKELVQSLLTFSRSSAPERREETDLNVCVRQALSLVLTQTRIRGVEVIQELDSEPPGLTANTNQIEQAVINLCNNAIDAMPGGGRLTVRTGHAPRDGGVAATLEIADTGAGIPENLRARVFEPFFTTKEVGKGTGLGLALVHEIVKRHGGEVELRSEEGKGTSFLLTFPASVKKPAAS